jgi:hypothetical protein
MRACLFCRFRMLKSIFHQWLSPLRPKNYLIALYWLISYKYCKCMSVLRIVFTTHFGNLTISNELLWKNPFIRLAMYISYAYIPSRWTLWTFCYHLDESIDYNLFPSSVRVSSKFLSILIFDFISSEASRCSFATYICYKASL